MCLIFTIHRREKNNRQRQHTQYSFLVCSGGKNSRDILEVAVKIKAKQQKEVLALYQAINSGEKCWRKTLVDRQKTGLPYSAIFYFGSIQRSARICSFKDATLHKRAGQHFLPIESHFRLIFPFIPKVVLSGSWRSTKREPKKLIFVSAQRERR